MSTVALTLNKNEVNAIERNVGSITVGSGKLVVVPQGAEPTVVPPAEVRGDADETDDKETGTYESRPRNDLYDLAKERGLDVSSRDTKAEIIAKLRD